MLAIAGAQPPAPLDLPRCHAAGLSKLVRSDLMGFLRQLGFRHRARHSTERSLLGGVDSVSPTLIAGWVHHPQHHLVEVRLLIGPHLLAQARVGEPRPDVESHLGLEGAFGFQLAIPDVPFPRAASDPPRVVALTADGSVRFDLPMLVQTGQSTPLLQLVMRQEFRGLRGHFDGLTPDGLALHGWCVRTGSTTPARVWLHAQGVEPRELLCDCLRPGMRDQGLPDASGFLVTLQDLPELSGRPVWVGFDRDGQLPLPSGHALPLHLPTQSAAVVARVSHSSQPRLNAELTVSLATPSDLQSHWERLEEFRLLLDRIEIGIEAASKADARPTQILPSKRRSARFRLWR